jgi:hypothetical protein
MGVLTLKPQNRKGGTEYRLFCFEGSSVKDHRLVKTGYLIFESAAQPRFQKLNIRFY